MASIATNFSRLFGPLSAPKGAAAPAAPKGSGPWDTGLGVSMGDQLQLSQTATASSAARMLQGMLGTFQAGVQRDLAGQNQLQALSSKLSGLSVGQLQSIQGLLNQAGNDTERVFILKAFTAGESWDNLVGYAAEMRSMPESEVIRRSTMRDDADVVQQWQDSCGPTLMQTIAGEADPRYAWELNKTSNLAALDPNGAAQALAEQQKQWLEQYGGVAVERGQSGGQGIALNQILNDMMGPLVGATYQTNEVTDARQATDRIAQIVQTGYDVPLRISWNRPGDSQDSGHFVLAMAVRGNPGSREFQIHDPWTGRTAWVTEASLQQDSFAPIFNSYARLSHYYEAQPGVQTA